MSERLNKFIHSRVFIVILILVLICTTLLIGTYAWFTWSSTDNTTLTMSIGKMADVTFISGNDINSGLTPVFNYTDGLSTNFSINNRSTETLNYVVKLNITTIASELISEDVKWTLVKDNNVVKEGNLSTARDGASITLRSDLLAAGMTSYVFYLYIDGNIENALSMMGKTLNGTIIVEAEETTVTPLSDFDYYLGSEYSTVESLNYHYYEDYSESQVVNVEFPCAITLDKNEVLLARYIGDSTSVSIPDTYVVDGITYNVTVLSYAYHSDGSYGHITTGEFIGYNGYLGYYTGIFYKNDNIDCVIFGDNIKLVSGYYYLQEGFDEMGEYIGDYWEVGTIENDASYLFLNCTNLVNVPVMPSSVTRMDSTFSNCTSLTGTVRINSSNVTNVNYIFYGTTRAITVEVPSGSTTYTKISALTTSNGKPSNVTLSTY